MFSTFFNRFDEGTYLPVFFKKEELPSQSQIDKILSDTSSESNENGLVRIAIPAREYKHYKKIQNLRKKYFPLFKEAWDSVKPKIAKAYIESLDESVKKVNLDLISSGLQIAYSSLRSQFNQIANLAFGDGISFGNSYFEDMFKVSGLSDTQVDELKKDYLTTFGIKSQDLFETQVLNSLDDSNVNNQLGISKILDSFDRFLLAYAGVASSVAYDVFANSIDFLNDSIVDQLGSISLFGNKPFALQWVLGEVATVHSPDCLLMSQGNFTLKGVGVWDPQELANVGLIPQSALLDCGGSCRCHLRPISFDSDDVTENVVLESFTSPFKSINDHFEVIPNLSAFEVESLFKSKGWFIPDSIKESLTSVPFFRRREFLENIPVKSNDTGVTFNFINRIDEGWNVGGFTTLNSKGKSIKLADITLNIEIPASLKISNGDIPLGSIPKPVLDKINQVFAHELGHSFLLNVPKSIADKVGVDVTSTIFDQTTLKRINDVIKKEYEFSLSKVNAKVKNRIDELDNDVIPNNLKADVKLLKDIFASSNGEEYGDAIKFLYKNVIENKNVSIIVDGKSVIVDAKQALLQMTNALKKLGINIDLISDYQLFNVDEYWAEFVGLMAVDPSRARLFNERLSSLFSKEFKDFGKNIFSKTDLLLPDQVSVNQLLNIPEVKALPLIPPNSKFNDIVKSKQVTTNTRAITSKNARAQVKRVFDKFPTLLRSEFFDEGVGITFLSKGQMRKVAGTSTHTAVLDVQTNNIIINNDKWKTLSLNKKAEILSELSATSLFKKLSRGNKEKIKEVWGKTVNNILNHLEIKSAKQGLKPGRVENLLELVFNNPSVWTNNFDAISKLLKKIPDLPVKNIESLRDFESLWRSFIKDYVTKSQTISPLDSELYDILSNTLTV